VCRADGQAVQREGGCLLVRDGARTSATGRTAITWVLIEAPWLVNSGHGASLRHHNRAGGAELHGCGAMTALAPPRWLRVCVCAVRLTTALKLTIVACERRCWWSW
jgi:hypothetical protein